MKKLMSGGPMHGPKSKKKKGKKGMHAKKKGAY